MVSVKRQRIASPTRQEKQAEEQEEEEGSDEEDDDGGGLDREKRNWASLTEPLLQSVLRRLVNLEDFFAFRGVCRSWRALAAPTPEALAAQPPLILLKLFPSYTEVFYDLARGRLYRAHLPWRIHSRCSLAYAHGHLVTTNVLANNKLLLWNIFSEARIRLPTAPEPFLRVLVSSHPAGGDCLVLLLHKRTTVLQYCRVGDPRWTIRDWKMLAIIEDMMFFRDNRLYAVTGSMVLLVVDLDAGPQCWLLGDRGAESTSLTHKERWLAESDGELLVLCRRYEGGFDVFRWNWGSCGWVKVLDLGGRTVFLGPSGFAGSIAATGLGIRGNCVYYGSDRKDAWSIFSLADQSVEVVSPDSPGLLRGPSSLDPVWIFPGIC